MINYILSALFGIIFYEIATRIFKGLTRQNENVLNLEIQPKIKPCKVAKGKQYYVTAETFTFKGADGVIYEIPAGYEFDGASIPALFWGIIGHSFNPCYLRAALIHDWRYDTAARGADLVAADAEFKTNLRAANNRKLIAVLMWLAVRLYSTFNKKKIIDFNKSKT